MTSSSTPAEKRSGEAEAPRGLVENLREHFRESPVAMSLCGCWVLVFALMLVYQGGVAGNGDLLTAGIAPRTGLRFGAQMTAYLQDGQLWRTLTASFVHFSLLHLLVNLVGLYQLSPLLESWYGGAQFLGVYVLIAGLGNMLAAGAKMLLSSQFPGNPAFQDLPSAGGSVVLVGLVALLAVVGWRSRSRFGDYIRAQMVGFLAFTAILGVMIPNIDNFGHAGGAVIGALVGFAHRPLLRSYEAKKNRWMGPVAALLIAGAAIAQYLYGRLPEPPVVESPQVRMERSAQAIEDLINLQVLYQQLALQGPQRKPAIDLATPYNHLTGQPRGVSNPAIANLIRSRLKHLDSLQSGLERGRTEPGYQRMKELALAAIDQPPMPGEITLFQQSLLPLVQQATVWLVEARSQMSAPPGQITVPSAALKPEPNARAQQAAPAAPAATPATAPAQEDDAAEPPFSEPARAGETDSSTVPQTSREPSR